MASQTCPSCCFVCAPRFLPSTISRISDPFSLPRFLPAGTIQTAAVSQIPCQHAHAEDGWHALTYDVSPENELGFLIEHEFVAATYRFTATEDRVILIIRVYIIPYDLPNYGGKLRIRDEVGIMVHARKCLRGLLPRIDQHPEAWNGRPSSVFKPFFPVNIDNRTMAELYGNLPSPAVPPCGPVPGLRTRLFMYQRRSVAALLDMEVSTLPVPDPLFIPITGMDGKILYLQPAQMEILQDQPRVATNRGGILCEELGTGKTIMILALVLLTQNQLSSPEETEDDSRPVMTPLAFRHFPDDVYRTARSRMNFRSFQPSIPEMQGQRIPSLVEILYHRIRVNPPTRELRDEDDALSTRRLKASISANTPFYLHFQAFVPENSRSKRHETDPGARVMYLTTATLIVVPKHLVSQWAGEIYKHCFDDALRFLVVGGQNPIPEARVLASNYDVILMSHDAFSREAVRDKLSSLHTWNACFCPPLPDSRVPDCQCVGLSDASPLLQIRWKRLVIDEGHRAANVYASLTSFAKLLEVEHRWIVTGTPTTNMLGLSFGRNSNLPAEPTDPENEPMPYSSSEDEPVTVRVWNDFDREDLRKLAAMMIHFLRVPNFAAESKNFDVNVIAPLLEKVGPLPGAIRVLNQVMQMQMIRHRIEDVEYEVELPPITKEDILLDLDPYALKSYNAFQVAIATNIIDSERVGIDYIFDPRNVLQLRILSTNMNQLMFWSVAEDLYNVDALLENLGKSIKKAIEKQASGKVSLEDLQLLQQSEQHLLNVVHDSLWRSIQTSDAVPFLVSGVPPEILKAWTRTPGTPITAAHLESGTAFMQPDRLVTLRRLVVARPLMREADMIERGEHLAALEEERIQSMTKKGRRLKHIVSQGSELAGQRKALGAAKKMASRQSEMEMELRAAQMKEVSHENALEVVDFGGPVPSPPPANTSSTFRPALPNAKLIANSPLASVHIHSSASSKMNFILNEVAMYSGSEKFLIFSQFPLSLAQVADGLDLVEVKYLQLTALVDSKAREHAIVTFESCDTYRVLLMDLKHGARGLNLITASRIIFCEPVWQADVESQAIKRVHRIGQIRPVVVKTIIIRGTAEHIMMQRRNALKSSNSKAPAQVLEEPGMREFIANPKFITDVPTLLPTLSFPLFNIPPELNRNAAVSSKPTSTHNDGVSNGVHPRKRPTVTFADLTSRLPVVAAPVPQSSPVESNPQKRVAFRLNRSPPRFTDRPVVYKAPDLSLSAPLAVPQEKAKQAQVAIPFDRSILFNIARSSEVTVGVSNSRGNHLVPVVNNVEGGHWN